MFACIVKMDIISCTASGHCIYLFPYSCRNCPIDLKEAITSIVFASPRCGDVPELLDVRKQFSAKYGKEFISAAIELRPQCGVSRLVLWNFINFI